MTVPASTSPLSYLDQLTVDIPFCTDDTVDDCLSYLNQEFQSIGLSSICTHSAAVDSRHVITSLVNAAYSLLQRFRRCIRSRDELQESKYRAESNLEHIQQDRNRLSSELQQRERDLMQAQLHEKQLSHNNKTLIGKLKTEKDEVRRLLVVMQHRDAQYKHSIRKKELELARLKQRLHEVLASSKADAKLATGGLEMSDLLVRADGKRGRWKVSNNNMEEEIYCSVISAHEDKHKQLVVENYELREMLTHVLTQLSVLPTCHCHSQSPGETHSYHDDDCKLDDRSKSSDDDDDDNANDTFVISNSSSCSDTTHLTTDQMSLPLSLIETDVKAELMQRMTELKIYINNLHTALLDGENISMKRPETHQQQQQHPSLTGNNIDLALNSDRKMVCGQLTEFNNERKCQVAELECQLNKQCISAVEMDRCKQSVMLRHRPRSAVARSSSPASRRLIHGTLCAVYNNHLLDQSVSNTDSELQLSGSRSQSCGRMDNQHHSYTSATPLTVTSCCSVDMRYHGSVSASSPLVSVGKPHVTSSQTENLTDDSYHN